MSNKISKIVEIKGTKFDLDMRQAVRIDTLRVGDRVRLLKKGYSDYTVHNGVVAGFEPFQKLPTIVIAYLEVDYSRAELKFISYNAKTEDVEIVKSIDDPTKMDLDRSMVANYFNKEIAKRREEIADLERKYEYFETQFAAYWSEVVPVLEDNSEDK